MMRTSIELLLITLILILAQVLVFNNMCLFNVAVPFAFIYVILRMPVSLSMNLSLTIGFFLGLVIDVFSDTYGMNALSCTLLTAVRKPALRLYVPRIEELSNPCPSMLSLGSATYAKYALTMSLIYCLVIFLIEQIAIINPLIVVARIIFSTILTTLLLIGIDCLTIRRREKRL